MKQLIASTLILLPAMLLAQTATEPAKKSAVKSTAKTPSTAKSKPGASLHGAAHQADAGSRAAEAALTPGELAIAGRVHTGQMPCELGASVLLETDAQAPGYFNVQGKGFRYRMHPVETSTGAIRLEDRHAGAVWLQLANKSMLMDQKQGRRLADECSSPTQVAVAEALKKNPAPSLLDSPIATK